MTSARRCRCGTLLAQDNAGVLCGVCQREPRRDRAPDVPPDFWHTDAMAAALASGDLGQVVRAYRSHPFHGRRPLAQSVVANWLHLSQSALSRIETGQCRLTIDDINWFAGTLGLPVALRWSPTHEAGEYVDPLSRRSLFGAGVGAALGLNATTAPATAREINPELVSHWMHLMHLLGQHDGLCGAHAVLDAVRHELGIIGAHRGVAHGELRTELLRVEARWTGFASWLSDDAGDWHRRDAWAERAHRLAREAKYPNLAAYIHMRRSQWATDSTDAITYAQAASATPNVSSRIRALCTLKEARGHALARDATACQTSIARARDLLDEAASEPRGPWDDLAGQDVTSPYVLADEARCWLHLEPNNAVDMFDDVLAHWPTDRTRGRGIHQAHLAVACATADEPERAAAEAIKAIDIARTTKSNVTVLELKRLDRQLAACDVPAAADFREAFATL